MSASAAQQQSLGRLKAALPFFEDTGPQKRPTHGGASPQKGREGAGGGSARHRPPPAEPGRGRAPLGPHGRAQRWGGAGTGARRDLSVGEWARSGEWWCLRGASPPASPPP